MSYCILINNIVDVANCFVIFNPPSICYFQLSIANELSDFSFHIIWDKVIPVFEKYDFSDKIFSFFVGFKGWVHGIENSFRISLIHCIKKSCWSEVDIFELIVSVEPEGIQVWMKSDEKFLVLRFALLGSG